MEKGFETKLDTMCTEYYTMKKDLNKGVISL